jgi:alkaline phosphatase D
MERQSHTVGSNEPDDHNAELSFDDDQAESDDYLVLSTSFSPLQSARVWIVVFSIVSFSLSVVIILLAMYILNNENMATLPESPIVNNESVDSRISALLHNATLPQWKSLPDTTQVLTKIAFGSCNSQEMPQPHWDTLTHIYQPDLFILAGDNVYGDCLEPTCQNLREAYRDMAHHASVQGAAPMLPVYATLDDHDYGLNDAYQSNPYKEIARELFAEFFDIPRDEFQEKDGVYRAQIWGTGNRRLQIILLDTRYARSPFNRTGIHNAPYTPVLDPTQRPIGADGTTVDEEGGPYAWQMLSEKQWSWFEEQLQQPANLRLVVSSIQVLTESSNYEAWRQLPHEQTRLFRLIAHKSVVLLSGDVHVGGFYEYGSLVEITSSSLTHTVPIGDQFTVHCPTLPNVCELPDAHRVGDSGHAIYENNFGSVEIDWTNKTFTVALRRTENSLGSSYLNATRTTHHVMNQGNAGDAFASRTYSFPF